MKLHIFIVTFVVFYDKISFISSLNLRPIIGIMTQETSEDMCLLKESFIRANYVKFLEASGAQVVPIFIYKPWKYYVDILKKINGVLFPGGEDLLKSRGYGRTARIIFEIATKMNDEDDYFPLWGTCLGFEFLHFAVAKKLWMKACSADDLIRNIEINPGYQDTRMFSELPVEMEIKMRWENVSLHLHRWCLTYENYTLSGLDQFYRVLAWSKDAGDLPFVSVVEAYNYPYYGVSFHPERVLFDWKVRKNPTPRSLDAIRISQYFGNFFVNEARKSYHHFPTPEEESYSLIYNYCPKILDTEPSNEVYLFD